MCGLCIPCLALYFVLGHWQLDAGAWSDAIQSAIGGMRPWEGDIRFRSRVASAAALLEFGVRFRCARCKKRDRHE